MGIKNNFQKYIVLERYLNKFKFHDIPLGGVIADQYILAGINGVPDGKEILKNLLADYCYLLISALHRTKIIPFKKVLFTRISDKVHFGKMMNPIIEYYNECSTTLINPEIDLINFKGSYISIKDSFNTPLTSIITIFNLSIIIFISLFRKRYRLKIKMRESVYFSCYLFHQTRILAFYDYQFRNNFKKPELVLVEFDRNSIASPIILTARKHKIATITLVHGVINSYGFAPVLADKIFCFGDIQKKQLLQQGVPESKIIVTGTSIVDKIIEPALFKKKVHKPFTVCLGISPFGKDNIKYLITKCIKVTEKRNDTKLIIKLHPSHRVEDFQVYESKNIQVMSSSSMTNYDLFNQIDLLVVHSSGLGVEAALAGIPVVVFEIPGLDLGMGQIMIEEGGFNLLKNEHDLNNIVNNLKDDASFLHEINKSKKFANRFYFHTGKEAVNVIVDEVERMLKDNKT